MIPFLVLAHAAFTEEHDSTEAAELTAWIPERFCGLSVHTRNAPVTIQAVTEAALEVHTGGGQLHVGKTKATAAAVSTSGADISGSLTAESASSLSILLFWTPYKRCAGLASQHIRMTGY
jgi:hypothetical protein